MVKNKQSGQALLIVVLAMVVSLTVSLAVVSRSITNLRTSTEEENSQRAFSAAEAGVEQVLKTGEEVTTAIDLENKSQIKKVDIVPVSGTQVLVNGGNTVEKDDGADVWLVPHNGNTPDYTQSWNGNLTFYWGSSSDQCNPDPSINTMAALEIIVISGTQALPTSKRYAFDPCGARRASNNFASPPVGGGTIGGKSFANKTTSITVSSGLIARVIPLYSSTSIGVVGSIVLPSQGNRIESTGISGGTSRKIAFYQGYPTLPSEFFYILFSPR